MNEEAQKLVALGASAAVNCRPCLEYHLSEARRIGLSDSDVSAAIDIGLQVNQGAARKTREFAESLVDRGAVDQPEKATAVTGKRGCC